MSLARIGGLPLLEQGYRRCRRLKPGAYLLKCENVKHPGEMGLVVVQPRESIQCWFTIRKADKHVFREGCHASEMAVACRDFAVLVIDPLSELSRICAGQAFLCCFRLDGLTQTARQHSSVGGPVAPMAVSN